MWIDDAWCDSNCQDNTCCAYDGDDCEPILSCGWGSGCYSGFDTFRAMTESITRDKRLDEEELCLLWDLWQTSEF